MKRLSLIVLLFVALPSWAAPRLVIPTVTPATSDYVQIMPDTDAAAVAYVGLSGVDPFPSNLLKDQRIFVLPTRGLAPGTYRFAAIGTLDDEQTRTDFAVAIGVPVPVPPGPTPPVPPVPPIPEPTDPFYQGLKTTWAQETHANRHARKTTLASYYRDAAKSAQNPANLTIGGLRKVMDESAKLRFPPPPVIPATDAYIGTYLLGVLPKNPDTPMDQATRDLATRTFTTIADDLEMLK